MTTPTTPIDKETAVCRGCGRELDGKPYYMGGSAYHPITKERCPANFYGGYVCSEQCDFNASLELERSMPGHGGSQKYPGQAATNHIKQNWKNQ